MRHWAIGSGRALPEHEVARVVEVLAAIVVVDCPDTVVSIDDKVVLDKIVLLDDTTT